VYTFFYWWTLIITLNNRKYYCDKEMWLALKRYHTEGVGMLSWKPTNCHTCLLHFHATAPLCLSAPFPCLVSMTTLIRSEETLTTRVLLLKKLNIFAIPVLKAAKCSANVTQWVEMPAIIFLNYICKIPVSWNWKPFILFSLTRHG